jgi:hypothetical protein
MVARYWCTKDGLEDFYSMFLARTIPLVGMILFGTIWMSAAQAQTNTIGASLDWRKLDEDMLTFVCLPEHAPGWCPDALAGVRPALPRPPPASSVQDRRRGGGRTPPPPPAPPKSVDDETWQNLLAELSRRRPRPIDITTLERRGFEDKDPTAFEMLGYVYATGWGRPKDLAVGYQYYGLALVLGHDDSRANLDELWRFLSTDEQRFIQFRFQRALTRP